MTTTTITPSTDDPTPATPKKAKAKEPGKGKKAVQREASKKLIAQLKPGQVLARTYRGKECKVKVLKDGFKYEEEVYSSLSAVAKAITGYRTIDGIAWFGLKDEPAGK